MIKTLRRAVVKSQRALGITLGRLADRQDDPAGRQRWWREAHHAYEEGLHVSEALESEGQFEPADAELRQELRDGLARSERGLAGARVSSR